METWEKFSKDKIRKILVEKRSVLDIGGGLRVDRSKNNRYDPQNEWMRPLLEKIEYKVMDPVPDYHPDIIGDIHKIPLESGSVEAVICNAVLEHVENPFVAVDEMHRILTTGGYMFVYVPFLYYYHAEKGYYADYWRFTKDSIPLLFKSFASVDLCPVRGAIATLTRLTPLGRYHFFEQLASTVDRITGKSRSNQVSGYFVFLTK